MCLIGIHYQLSTFRDDPWHGGPSHLECWDEGRSQRYLNHAPQYEKIVGKRDQGEITEYCSMGVWDEKKKGPGERWG